MSTSGTGTARANEGPRIGDDGRRLSWGVLLAFAATSAVYLLYTPHALPVLDDWMYLQLFHQARAGGIASELAFLRHLIDNTWIVQFRIFWASLLPVFVLAALADFAGWAYFLFAWTVHLFTAWLLWRIILVAFEDAEAAFAAGAIYCVFPPTNNPIFWPVSNVIYYMQSLLLLAWFYLTWKKLVLRSDCRYTWRDFALLLPVIFSGEQILPALALLLPLGLWLAGKRRLRQQYFRFCLFHWGAMVALLGVYVFAVNGMPILKGFQNRYESAHPWSLRPLAYMLFGALGLNRDFVPWPPSWWKDAAWIALIAIAAAAFFWGVWRCGRSRPDSRLGELLLWSVGGGIFTYLPLARLSTFEWRYLYVPSMFLVAAGCAIIGLFWRPLRVALNFAVLAYCLTQTYLGMRECWIPQSREARAALDAIVTARPFAPRQIVVLSGDHLVNGVAPSFITGASWAQQSMLEHYTDADHIQGARDVVINERGEIALYRRDSFRYLHRQEFSLLRVFVRDRQSNRFLPKSLIALPAPDGRYEVLPMGPAAGARIPVGPLTLDELKRLPQFNEIYFARLIHSHMKPTDL